MSERLEGVDTWGSGEVSATCPVDLVLAVRELAVASTAVNWDDPAAESAHYAAAAPIIARVIAHRAVCTAGLMVKAEAYVWAGGASSPSPASATAQELLIESLLRDLVDRPAAAAACNRCDGEILRRG
jgi:hypothetical protein